MFLNKKEIERSILDGGIERNARNYKRYYGNKPTRENKK
jgi:hypothetical protein